MLKQVLALLLITAFSLQTFSRMLLVVSYYTNTNAYAKNCENKSRPQLHCDGKCQLAQKLKKQAQKEEQSTEKKSEKKDEVICYSKSFIPECNSITSIIAVAYLQPVDVNPTDRPRIIFHPPAT